MTTHRVPILLAKDSEGFWTAIPLEPETALVGTGETAADAISQIKSYLDWAYEKDRWKTIPDFQKPRLMRFRVELRPQYQEPDRVYPCAELMTLPVDCVVGQRSDGVLTCVAPFFGVRFDYNEKTALEALLTDAVLSQLSGQSPRQLSRYWPPENWRFANSPSESNREFGGRGRRFICPHSKKARTPSVKKSCVADTRGLGCVRRN